jgi:hypothetical protein
MRKIVKLVEARLEEMQILEQSNLELFSHHNHFGRINIWLESDEVKNIGSNDEQRLRALKHFGRKLGIKYDRNGMGKCQ